MPPVHPHVRGEYIAVGWTPDCSSGSSPRAWGIPWCGRHTSHSGRFIPTCVGNTSYDAGAGQKGAVHPHVRGEYASGLDLGRHRVGSSPRAWGIQKGPSCANRIARFIPTCVGNTHPMGLRRGESSVHPHVRGEYVPSATDQRSSSGSSPRAWGIRSGAGH